MAYAFLFENKSEWKKLRRSLRQSATLPERLLWNKLKQRQMGGFKFRRQFQIDNYIVDFYCDELKLVVELDGSSHENKQIEDQVRQKYLEAKGCAVIRYFNEQILKNSYFVLDDILECCKLRIQVMKSR